MDPKLPEAVLKDRDDAARGALYLAALGDSIGLPQETQGLAGGIGRPELLGRAASAADLPDDLFARPWGVWASREDSGPGRGVVSDDTATRLCLLQRWLREDGGLAAEGFETWLRRAAPGPAAPTDVHRLWLDMLEAARVGRSAHFYHPGEPVIFGPFLFLEAALGERDPASTYARFSQICPLDIGYGKAVTGFLAAWLTAEAAAARSPITWSERCLDEARWLLGEGLGGGTLTQAFEAARVLGASLRDATELEFAEGLRDRLLFDESAPYAGPREGNRAFDPLLFFKQLVAAIAGAGADPPRALRALAGGAGDTDTLASALGLVMGAGLGFEALKYLRCGPALLGEEMRATAGWLRAVLGLDLESGVALYLKRYRSGS